MLSYLIPKAYAAASWSCTPADTSVGNQLGSRSSFFNPLCPITGNGITIGELVDRVISIILYAAAAVAVIYLLWSGINYITAGGDDVKATTARKGIINAVIGIIIIVLAFVIEKAAANLFA